ncbi:acylphosphatase [Metabacillus iocasae]|uniref:acylphosphatase n=1 Tax=Priestia iocasae TaxID=2291674 RepID=A0ABS2QYW7_9BACI|nr:acylphosphatase [Metabacillus iocasae]MBM7703654.1 acylphosphatase [Metabacillus iocasae]
MNIRIHLKMKGHVQGVGFRQFTQLTAIEYGLTGWVRNCEDGSVEVEVEGPKPRVDTFVSTLRKGPHRFSHVDSVEIAHKSALENDKQFKIQH